MNSKIICEYCGAPAVNSYHFISGSGAVICADCVEEFHKLLKEIESDQRKTVESVRMFTPDEPKKEVKHNFRVIEGGKK